MQAMLQTQNYKTKMNIKRLTAILSSKDMLAKLQSEDVQDLELVDSDKDEEGKEKGDLSAT